MSAVQRSTDQVNVPCRTNDTRRTSVSRQAETGQALSELLVFTSLAVLLLLALFQLHLSTSTVQRSISAAHGVLFQQLVKYNCAEKRANDACSYDSDTRGKVIWSPRVLPEVNIPTFRVFSDAGIDEPRRLWSNSPLNRRSGRRAGEGEFADDTFDGCEGRPCKRTKLGVGTWMPLESALDTAGVRMPSLARPLLAGK